MNPVVASHLAKTFSTGIRGTKVTALRDLSFEVYEGEVFGLLGPNGAGKTTAIKILMGLLYPSSGHAQILGRDPWDVTVKGRIGFLPEGPYFYEYLTGEEFLDFYGRLFGQDSASRRRRVQELFSLVGLTGFEKLKLRRYSKGMLQRVGLAQALINDPSLIVLDEPMSGLDPVGRKELSDIILGLKAAGKTIFFSSHILSDVQRICDRIAVVHKGSLLYLGRVTDFLGEEPRCFEVTLAKVSESFLTEVGKGALEIKRNKDEVTLRFEKAEAVDALVAQVGSQGPRIKAILPIYPSLEELFVQLVQAGEDKG